MRSIRMLIGGAVAVALTCGLAVPVGALSLKVADLENLVDGNTVIVVATVQDGYSYWNRDGGLLLTDFQVAVTEVLKGQVEGELTFTMMGGSDGKFTTIIPGGAILLPDQSYVLFLRQEILPGTDPVTTIAEHSQGVFDITDRGGVLWATSQAKDAHLLPGEDLEEEGGSEPPLGDVPGGEEGLALDELVGSIKELVARGTGTQGVK